ncbi:hypothetical protein OKW21_003045 [Catalinimonas alkaloidigena]|uniref:hypothetical protein n=1 Tax=Catalinimonas alkaloidigena TaxID=1075417 RepID=UPI002406E719|nr:hypothetical protein [Catalinimonas alkaloidigena]MDF9797782.1 hypothetical protein [Catalinimonas alkaloidigena]
MTDQSNLYTTKVSPDLSCSFSFARPERSAVAPGNLQRSGRTQIFLMRHSVNSSLDPQ